MQSANNQKSESLTSFSCTKADKCTVYFNRTLADGIVQHRFHRLPGWEAKYRPNTLEYAVLHAMKDNGVYSIVSVENATTSVVGPDTGVVRPSDIIGHEKGPSLFTTGGFFIHIPHYFKPSGGEPFREQYLYWTVGPTSLTPNIVPLDPAYEDVMKTFYMTDGTYYTSGPVLNEALDMSPPSRTQVNTPLGRFQYHAYDTPGVALNHPLTEDLNTFDQVYADRQIAIATGARAGPSIDVDTEDMRATGRTPKQRDDGSTLFAAQAPAHPFIRSLWAFVPANLSHGNQRNERSATSRHPTGQLLSHVYNCQRHEGLDINELRTLMIAGTGFLKLPFSEIKPDDVWANDGGASVFQIFVDRTGTPELLALGGQTIQKYPLGFQATQMRDVPHALKIRAGRQE